LENGRVLLSEYEKYLLVNLLYQGIEAANCDYIKNFYDTLAILDAGYMSSRKSEARRVFREIADISIIAENSFKDFCQDIIKFLQTGILIYSKFKQEVLTKYLISIPFYLVENYQKNVYYSIFNNLLKEEQDLIKENPRIKNWLSGIFIANGCYDSLIGYQDRKVKREKELKILAT